jgi:Plasmid encoded RepA protein
MTMNATVLRPDDETAIRDSDLRAQLDRAVRNGFFPALLRNLVDQQRQRDVEHGRKAQLSAVARRREDVRDLIQSNPLSEADRHYIHSVLALCALPYRRPVDTTRDFIREYGKSSLVVQSGYLKDPITGKMTPQGLPYGPKARLLMLHICTMAVRQNSHQIEIADSMSAFIRDLGFPVTGGERGTISQFKEQLNRLAAARMQIGVWREDRTTTISTQPIEAFDMWLPTNPDQRMLWSTTLTLDKRFYETLRQHALPVDIRTLRAFTQSAKQIDIVLWLASRLRSVTKPVAISWAALQSQFGSDVTSRARKFRQGFADDLAHIVEVFPRVPVRVTEKGLLLSPTDPDKLFIPSVRHIKA